MSHGCHPEESELIRRIAQGDVQALAALYDRYAPAVHGEALRLLGTPEAAEEAVLDVFQQVWRLACHVDPARLPVGVWLAALTHRRARAGDQAIARR